MPGNLLLMCKIIALAILATGHFQILQTPFLPFIPGLDELAEPEVFQRALQIGVVVSALALLCNRWVRGSALILGGCMLLAVVSSRTYYGNNKTFCGLALVLSGLSDFDRPAYLVRWQLALVYFGAALNKALDVDWLSGQFFEHWGGVRVGDPVYLFVADSLPPLVAGKILGWGTIIAEFFASVALLVPRLVPLGLWCNILFQVGLLEFTGGTFTLFFYAMQAANFAFVSWPKQLLVYTPCLPSLFPRLVQMLDFDGLQVWRLYYGAPGNRKLTLVDGDRTFSGWGALRRLLLFTPALWLTLTLALALMPGPLGRRALVGITLLIFLPWPGTRSARTGETVEKSAHSE